MRRRQINPTPKRVEPQCKPLADFLNEVKISTHDNYVGGIIPITELQEVTYEEGTGASNFGTAMTMYLLSFRGNTSTDSVKKLSMNIVKKDEENKKIGVYIIFEKTANNNVLKATLGFTTKVLNYPGEYVEDEMNVDIGSFDLSTYDNNLNILVGEQIFEGKNPNLLMPWITIDFRKVNKIIFNNMPINIRNFFDMNTNEFIVKEFKLEDL